MHFSNENVNNKTQHNSAGPICHKELEGKFKLTLEKMSLNSGSYPHLNWNKQFELIFKKKEIHELDFYFKSFVYLKP